MWEKQEFTDVALVAITGEQIWCHRAVLSVASPVFERMLSPGFREAIASRIDFKVSVEVLHIFLECIYNGTLRPCIKLEHAESLIRLADIYDMPSLTGACALMIR